MVNHFEWLQLFAGEGAGASGSGEGAAAATGVENADAGHQRLKELGVPEARIRKNRAYMPKAQEAAKPAAAEPEATQAAAAEDAKPTEDTPARMSWEEISKDPEYSAEISKIVRARLKESGAAQEAMKTLMPWLKTMAKDQGLDPENIDYQALVKSVNGEYENQALEKGVSKEIARQLDQQQRTLEQQRLDSHMRSLEQQSEALKATFPGFNLQEELKNERFSRMVSPNVGMSVDDAYYAIHRKEIQAAAMQVAAQKAAQQISNAIQSGSRRPDESGVAAQASSVTNFDYSKMSKAERDALKKRIYSGERILPGQI